MKIVWLVLVCLVHTVRGFCDDVRVPNTTLHASDLHHNTIELFLDKDPYSPRGHDQFIVKNAPKNVCEVYFEMSRLTELQDWINDLRMDSVCVEMPDAKELCGASGFINSYKSLVELFQSRVKEICSPSSMMRLMGYSRGGGMATVFAAHLLAMNRKVELWTWGALKSVSRKSASFFESANFTAHRFVYGSDPWVRMPCDRAFATSDEKFCHIGPAISCPAPPPEEFEAQISCISKYLKLFTNIVDHVRYPFPSTNVDLGFLTGSDAFEQIQCVDQKCDSPLKVLRELLRTPEKSWIGMKNVLVGCIHTKSCHEVEG